MEMVKFAEIKWWTGLENFVRSCTLQLFVPPVNMFARYSAVHDATIDAVISTHKDRKRGKGRREDGVSVDIFERSRKEAHNLLPHLFSQCIHKERLAESGAM